MSAKRVCSTERELLEDHAVHCAVHICIDLVPSHTREHILRITHYAGARPVARPPGTATRRTPHSGPHRPSGLASCV
eukprot:1007374-Prymnesium_polylepis.1